MQHQLNVFLVGGAVRDALLGKPVSDRDWVVLGSSPEEMLSLGFTQVGASFPVFLHPETGEEYALARTERKSGDGYLGFETYHGRDVTLEQDLSRRDFTINAMAQDAFGTIHDPFGGQEDLKSKTLRHVGDAFSEDPLRVIRMARFLARLEDFMVDDGTFALAQRMVRSKQLGELPHERFAAEIRKVFSTCSPRGCSRFFSVLETLRCHEHVAFFKDIPPLNSFDIARHLHHLPVEHRHIVFAALCSNDLGVTEHIGGSIARHVRRLLEILWEGQRSDKTLYDLLQSARAFDSNSVWLDLLIKAVEVLDMRGRNQKFSAHDLTFGAKIMQAATAGLGERLAQEGVTGKNIAEALKQARMDAMYMLNL